MNLLLLTAHQESELAVRVAYGGKLWVASPKHQTSAPFVLSYLAFQFLTLVEFASNPFLSMPPLMQVRRETSRFCLTRFA